MHYQFNLSLNAFCASDSNDYMKEKQFIVIKAVQLENTFPGRLDT